MFFGREDDRKSEENGVVYSNLRARVGRWATAHLELYSLNVKSSNALVQDLTGSQNRFLSTGLATGSCN